jgi:DNA-directed RNA polymerase subunit RPC12/RpoP
VANLPTTTDRVEVPRDAFLRTTGQLWKLVVAGVVLPWPAVALGFWALRRIRPNQPLSEVGFAVGAEVILAASIALLVISVKCPRCDTRLLVRAFRDPAGLAAITALLGVRTCPNCGHDPRVS